MPQKGLPINELALEMLSFEAIQVSRGKSFDSLQLIMIDFQKKKNVFKYRLCNPNDFIKEHFIELRNEVQLATEQFHEQIDNINKELIDEIGDYENELINSNKNSDFDLELLKYFEDFAKELESFQLETDEYLKQYSLNDDKLNKLYQDAKILKEKNDSEIENLNDFILRGRLLNFKLNKVKLDQTFLGEMEGKASFLIDSHILISEKKTKELNVLCEFPVYQRWNLIYRASQDGFQASDFHSKCDEKPNTLVIIKSTNDKIFGGYTERSWSGASISVDKPDSNAFIFSLTNKENRPLKIKCSPNNGIRCNDTHGPIFGGQAGSSDLVIANNSNKNNESFSNLGHYYTHPELNPNEASSFLAGSYNFRVSEIEVYTSKKL